MVAVSISIIVLSVVWSMPWGQRGLTDRPMCSLNQILYVCVRDHTTFQSECSLDTNLFAQLQKHNEQKLCEAFEHSKDVFLIFSVNLSGHFQGYARMISTNNSRQVMQCSHCRGDVLR